MTSWQVAEWQLAIGVPATGTFDLTTDRATRTLQLSMALGDTGEVTPELLAAHGTQPLTLRGGELVTEKLLRSIRDLTRAGAREWNSLALMVTRGRWSNGKRYDWNQDWCMYHARAVGAEWSGEEREDWDAGDMLEVVQQEKTSRAIMLGLSSSERVQISTAPILGAAGVTKVPQNAIRRAWRLVGAS